MKYVSRSVKRIYYLFFFIINRVDGMELSDSNSHVSAQTLVGVVLSTGVLVENSFKQEEKQTESMLEIDAVNTKQQEKELSVMRNIVENETQSQKISKFEEMVTRAVDLTKLLQEVYNNSNDEILIDVIIDNFQKYVEVCGDIVNLVKDENIFGIKDLNNLLINGFKIFLAFNVKHFKSSTKNDDLLKFNDFLELWTKFKEHTSIFVAYLATSYDKLPEHYILDFSARYIQYIRISIKKYGDFNTKIANLINLLSSIFPSLNAKVRKMNLQEEQCFSHLLKKIKLLLI